MGGIGSRGISGGGSRGGRDGGIESASRHLGDRERRRRFWDQGKRRRGFYGPTNKCQMRILGYTHTHTHAGTFFFREIVEWGEGGGGEEETCKCGFRNGKGRRYWRIRIHHPSIHGREEGRRRRRRKGRKAAAVFQSRYWKGSSHSASLPSSPLPFPSRPYFISSPSVFRMS